MTTIRMFGQCCPRCVRQTGEGMGLKRWMVGIRGKLIAIFVVIKVLPLLLLALLA